MKSKKRKVKRKLFFAGAYEIEAIESFLEQEAANGWMLAKFSGNFFTFEECEPIRLKFQVDYFDKATIFDTNPEDKTLDYIEYCKESGWHHVFSAGKMQIFYSYEENPIPIQTDENMKLKLASKATILANWVAWVFLPLIFGFGIITNVLLGLLSPRNYSQYSISVTNFMGFGHVVFWLGFTLFGIINMTRFGVFYFKNTKRLKNGLSIQYNSSKSVKRFGIFNKIFLLSLILFTAGIYAQDSSVIGMFLGTFFGTIILVLLINKITYRKWANRQINIALTIAISVIVPNIIIVGIVFSIIGHHDAKVSSGNTTYYYSKDNIDIKLDDLGLDKPDNFLYEETIRERDKTFLGMREVYSDYCHKDNNSYGYSINIFSSKFSSIINKYNKLVLGDKNYVFTELTATKNTWHSDKVLYGKNYNESMYVVIGEGRTFVITGDLNRVQAAELSSYYMKKI